MAERLTPDILSQTLAENEDVVAAVFDLAYLDQPAPLKFAALNSHAQIFGLSVEEALIDRLAQDGLLPQFADLLFHKFPHLEPEITPDDVVAFYDATMAAGGDRFDIDAFPGFLAKARRFHCRITHEGQAVGSGAIVSHRLVLTAAHVLGAMVDTPEDVFDIEALQRKIFYVVPGDGWAYPARVLWVSACLRKEEAGHLPPRAVARRFCDAALLRTTEPIGSRYGHVALAPPKPPEADAEALVLLHYPSGDFAYSHGTIFRQADDIRSQHLIQTDHGSSGGPGFCRATRFVGLHQGRWATGGRLVPYAQFHDNAEFRALLAGDAPPRRLWSLTDGVEGAFIIGRARYFEMFNAVLDGRFPDLRGIWIRRQATQRRVGLGFSFDIAETFLDLHDPGHILRRVQLTAETGDIFDAVHRAVFRSGQAPRAVTGVRRDETTQDANSEDRAKRLATELARHAAATGRVWLFFEDPSGELRDDLALQFQHLVRAMMDEPALYVIISGFETTQIAVQRPDSLADLVEGIPALLTEHLDRFTRRDVEDMVKAAAEDLKLDWSEELMRNIAQQAIDRAALQGTSYPVDALGPVAGYLQKALRLLVPHERLVA